MELRRAPVPGMRAGLRTCLPRSISCHDYLASVETSLASFRRSSSVQKEADCGYLPPDDELASAPLRCLNMRGADPVCHPVSFEKLT